MKKLVCLLFALVMALTALMPALSPACAAGGSFNGTRRVVLSADRSDIEHYIGGGRSTLDLLLRRSKPDWLNAVMSADGRNVLVDLSFDFESFADYCDKTAYLCGGPQTTVYDSSRDGLVFFECFESASMLHFLTAPLRAAGVGGDDPASVMEVEVNELTLRGKTYESEGPRFKVSGSSAPYRFNRIEIATDWSHPGEYVRTIDLIFNAAEPENGDIKALRRALKDAGELAEEELGDGSYRFTFTISAGTEDEILRQTILALGVPAGISEQESYKDETTVAVKRTEFFEASALLAEGGGFEMRSIYPESFTELGSYTESAYVNSDDNSVYVSGQDSFTFACERPAAFQSLVVETELPVLFGKTTRHIRFGVALELANLYHDAVKEELSDRLSDGMTLEIYDEGALRIFDVSYSTYFPNELQKFTAKVLGKGASFKREAKLLPYGKVTYNDKLPQSGIVEGWEPPRSVQVRYKLPGRSAKVVSGAETADGTATADATATGKTKITIRQWSFLPLLLWGAGLILLAVIVLTVLAKLHRRKHPKPEKPAKPAKTKKAKKADKHAGIEEEYSPDDTSGLPADEQPRFCGTCGTPIRPGVVFCPTCGRDQRK